MGRTGEGEPAEKPVDEPAPEAAEESEEQTMPENGGALELGVGAGGHFSTGANNPALLLSAGAGYRFNRAWRLGLGFDLKLHPWESATSAFHTLGVEVRFRFFDELFVAAGAGFAAGFVRKNDFQDVNYGIGWGAKIGYCYMPVQVFGLQAVLTLHQRWLGQLYTDFGATIGPAFRF